MMSWWDTVDGEFLRLSLKLKLKKPAPQAGVRVCLSHIDKNVFHDVIQLMSKFTNVVLFKSCVFVDESECNSYDIYS